MQGRFPGMLGAGGGLCCSSLVAAGCRTQDMAPGMLLLGTEQSPALLPRRQSLSPAALSSFPWEPFL